MKKFFASGLVAIFISSTLCNHACGIQQIKNKFLSACNFVKEKKKYFISAAIFVVFLVVAISVIMHFAKDDVTPVNNDKEKNGEENGNNQNNKKENENVEQNKEKEKENKTEDNQQNKVTENGFSDLGKAVGIIGGETVLISTVAEVSNKLMKGRAAPDVNTSVSGGTDQGSGASNDTTRDEVSTGVTSEATSPNDDFAKQVTAAEDNNSEKKDGNTPEVSN